MFEDSLSKKAYPRWVPHVLNTKDLTRVDITTKIRTYSIPLNKLSTEEELENEVDPVTVISKPSPDAITIPSNPSNQPSN